ncbi:MAG: hypothetical protein H6818_21395 [Phycisphaerales bacterium]|nr:hypothetical protein [Phycisphaerales bacterium]MCB9862346.1 hypothetical protein [Phycisphaerales bacterium]
MHRTRLLGIMVLIATMGSECPQNTTSNGMPGPTNSSGRHKLTVTLRSLNGCRGLDPEAEFFCRAMEAHIFIGDELFTRTNAPFNNGNFDNKRGGASDPDVNEFQVEAGKMVTIIAFESMGTQSRFTSADDREAFELGGKDRVEFLRFEGDPVSMPEAGVATLVMDSDKNVELVYQRMPTMIVSVGNTEPLLAGFWNSITIEAPEWLTLPAAGGENPLNGTTQNVSFDVASGFAFIAEMKTGTRITFDPGSLSGFEFDTWTDTFNQCGAGPCTLILGEDEFPIAHWKPTP